MKFSTLFLDESGKSSLAEKEDEPFLLTGVILDNDEINTIEGFFRYIKRKFGLPERESFHSYEIFENPKTRLPDSELISLSKTLTEFLSLIPINIIVVYIDKSEFKNILGVKSNEDFKGASERKEMRQLFLL